MARRLTATVDQLDRARLQERYQGLGVSQIGAAAARVPLRLAGEVKELRVVPRAGWPSLEVTIADGTGRAVAIFTGTRRLAGLALGAGILLEGVARTQGNRLVLLNPAYTLL